MLKKLKDFFSSEDFPSSPEVTVAKERVFAESDFVRLVDSEGGGDVFNLTIETSQGFEIVTISKINEKQIEIERIPYKPKIP